MMNDKAVAVAALPRYAQPRPAMRGRYLIRNPRSALIITAIDALLALSRLGRRWRPVPASPRRILLADWAHLGNVLLALPALQLLRRTFPDAEIGFLTGSWSRLVLDGTGLCDHVHLVDHFILSRAQLSRGQKIARYRRMRQQAIAELRTLNYDVAIDLGCHFPPAAPLFHAAGIPIRCGFTSSGFGSLLTHPVRWKHASRPICDYPRDLLGALWPERAWPTALAPCYPGHPRAALPDELMKVPYVVLHMGSGAPHREWPEENWIEVAAALVAAGWKVVLAGSDAREAERIHRLAAAFPPAKTLVFVDRPWADYVAVIANAAHVICLESSSAHIAAAFSVPTTAIYAGFNDPVQWGPTNPRARVLTAPVGCAPCYRGSGCAAMACIRGVTAAQVAAVATESLARTVPVS